MYEGEKEEEEEGFGNPKKCTRERRVLEVENSLKYGYF